MLVMIACESVEFRSAKMYVNENNLEKAEEFYLKALNTEPENALIPYLLAKDVYAPQSRWAEMATMFEKALAINPKARLPEYYMVDDELILTIEQAIPIKREQEWSKIFNAGVDKMTRGDLEASIEDFELAKRVLPTDGNAYVALYTLYLNEKQMDKALASANDGFKVAPENVKLIEVQGDIAKRDENFPLAEKHYLKAMDLVKTSDEKDQLHLKLFELYFLMDDFERARDTVDQIEKYDGDIAYNVGALYHSMAIEKYKTALEAYNSMITDSDTSPARVSSVIDAFEAAKELYVEARAHFRDAYSWNPDDNESRELVKEIREKILTIDETFIDEIKLKFK